MFTGIIEELGEVKAIVPGAKSFRLTVGAKKILSDLSVGDSVAVNGTCLTAAECTPRGFTADVMPETVRMTSLSGLKPGDRVNLERALPSGGRFGGHIVGGHVDGVGKITAMRKEDNAIVVEIESTESVLKYIVPKGSAAVDGISLTVVSCGQTRFCVSIIPHTAAQTTLGLKKPGDIVNLENDIIGKYVERLLGFQPTQASAKVGGIDIGFLKAHGFK